MVSGYKTLAPNSKKQFSGKKHFFVASDNRTLFKYGTTVSLLKKLPLMIRIKILAYFSIGKLHKMN